MHQVSISTQNRARAPDLLSALLPVNPVYKLRFWTVQWIGTKVFWVTMARQKRPVCVCLKRESELFACEVCGHNFLSRNCLAVAFGFSDISVRIWASHFGTLIFCLSHGFSLLSLARPFLPSFFVVGAGTQNSTQSFCLNRRQSAGGLRVSFCGL